MLRYLEPLRYQILDEHQDRVSDVGRREADVENRRRDMDEAIKTERQLTDPHHEVTGRVTNDEEWKRYNNNEILPDGARVRRNPYEGYAEWRDPRQSGETQTVEEGVKSGRTYGERTIVYDEGLTEAQQRAECRRQTQDAQRVAVGEEARNSVEEGVAYKRAQAKGGIAF
jgi:hypothetical protein